MSTPNKVTQGTGRALIPSGCVDVDELARMAQLMHDMLGNPQLQQEEGDAPTSVGSVRQVLFTLQNGFSSNVSTGAQVLELDGSTVSGETRDVYDPLSLWSGAAGSESGVGLAVKHPTTGEQVILIHSHLGGGGGGADGNDKVKVNSADAAAFLEDQLVDTGGSFDTGTYQQVFHEIVDNAGDKLVTFYTEKGSGGGGTDSFEVKVSATETSEAFLEDQFTNVNGSIPTDGQQVLFGTYNDDEIYAYLAQPYHVKATATDTTPSNLLDAINNSGTPDTGLQLVTAKDDGTGGKLTLQSTALVKATATDSAPTALLDAINNSGTPTSGYQIVTAIDDGTGEKIVLQTEEAWSTTDELVKVNGSEADANYLENQLVNTGTLTSGYQRVFFRTAGDNDTMYAETEEASGSSLELVDFNLVYGQSLTAASWSNTPTRGWTYGTGTVYLINSDGTEGSTATMSHRYPYAISPPSGKGYKGVAFYDGSTYKLVAIDLCHPFDWTAPS